MFRALNKFTIQYDQSNNVIKFYFVKESSQNKD
jgi:hypothetical protein